MHSREVSACLKIFRKNQSGNLPPSCNDREHSTLHMSRKLNKNQAILTTPSICCTCDYHSASEGRLHCWLEDSLGRWEFWLRSLSSVCFPSPCWLSSFSSENSYCIRCCGREYKALYSLFQEIAGKLELSCLTVFGLGSL